LPADLLSQTQYRFPEALAHFPSEAFYEGRLRTGTIIDPEVDLRFTASNFPWPMRGGRVFPNVFVQCSTEEEYGGSSKENVGQADLVCRIVELLRQNSDPNKFKPFDITVLSPYKLQIKNLGSRLPSTVPASTIDAFQGRESDIIVFCTVRSNASGDLGFLDDDRRLNVAWTRARFGRIVVGDKETLKTSKRWLSAVEDCIQVDIPAPIEK
jgi:superfamily I DNA and/or RNA helicase